MKRVPGTWIPALKHIEYFIPVDYASDLSDAFPESHPPAPAAYEVLFALTQRDQYRYFAPFEHVFYDVALESIIPCKTYTP